MSRRLYLVTYDITEPRRLKEVFKACEAFGDHQQYSVFRAELTPKGRAELVARLERLIDKRHDQVLFIDLGKAGPKAHARFTALGKPYKPPERRAVIV